MNRLQKAYERRMRERLVRFGARRPDEGARRLFRKGEEASRSAGISTAHSVEAIDAGLRRKLRPFRNRQRESDRIGGANAPPRVFRFFCDAGLGGLARWLRAAGYEARWVPGISDDLFLAEARRLEALALTTDSLMLERKLIRDGVIETIWVSPALALEEQVKYIFDELQLAPQAESRCMACGGRLRQARKEAVRDRIPPKTYRWRDEYFICEQCGKLFWHGTHWQRIRRTLETLHRDPKADVHS